MSLSNEKELLRATLVIGLIASIIALGPLVPKETPSISTIFGILVSYWFLYAIFTAYGISETENAKLSNRLRWLGALCFRFPVFVLAGILVVMIMVKSGSFQFLEWNYLAAWFSAVILYVAPKNISDKFRNWKEFTDRVKANWKDYALDWVLFFAMSSPLLVLQYYKYLF